MGLCLSCIRGDGVEHEDDLNERASLLGGGRLDDVRYQEELQKQKKRQNELNTIVNNLNDELIDVSSIPVGKIDVGSGELMSEDTKRKIAEEAGNLDEQIKSECEVKSSRPLFVEF